VCSRSKFNKKIDDEISGIEGVLELMDGVPYTTIDLLPGRYSFVNDN